MMLSSVRDVHPGPGQLSLQGQMVVQILLFVYVGLTIFFTFMLKFAGMTGSMPYVIRCRPVRPAGSEPKIPVSPFTTVR